MSTPTDTSEHADIGLLAAGGSGGSDLKEKLLKPLVIRNFCAYLEILNNLADIYKFEEPLEDDIKHTNNHYLDVMGFTLHTQLDALPTCQISLPAGRSVSNMFLKPNTKGDQIALGEGKTYEFIAVTDRKTYLDRMSKGEAPTSDSG